MLELFGAGVLEVFGFGIFVVTPLFQIKTFPDLTQVYLMLEIVFVEFILVHLVPAIVAELAGKMEAINSVLIAQINSGNLLRCICKGYRAVGAMSPVNGQ